MTVDSGASDNMVCERNFIINLKIAKQVIIDKIQRDWKIYRTYGIVLSSFRWYSKHSIKRILRDGARNFSDV